MNNNGLIPPPLWLLQRRRQMMAKRDEWAITQESNPKLMTICYNQGWASRPDKMSFAECAAVTVIGDGVAGHSPFYNCQIENFEEFRFFTGITTILPQTFVACPKLARLVFPPSVTDINGDGLFLTVTEVVLNEGLLRLSGWRALGVGTESLIMPSTLVSCSAYSFYYSNRLTSITFKSATPPTIASTTFSFYGGHTLPEIKVPSASLEAYKEANIWKDYKDIITAI